MSKKHSHSHKFRHKHGENILSIDSYAYASRLFCVNSGLKVGSALFFLLFGLMCNSIAVSLLLIIVMLLVTVCVGKLSLHDYFSLMLIPIVFIVLSSIAILFDFSTKPLGQYRIFLGFFYLITSDDNILQTIRLICRAMGAISCLYMMVLSTPTSEIIRLMRKCKVPQLVCELMHMIYRFIFILMDVQYRMTVSAKSRLGYCDVKTSFYSFGNIAGNLLVLSLRRANAYYDALEARCYDGDIVFLSENPPLQPKQLLWPLLLTALLSAVWLLFRYLGY